MNNLEKSLIEALSCEGLPRLPKEDGDGMWIKAIVKVTKCDNSSNYAIALNSASGNPRIIRDFGNMARIKRIDNIYPYYVMPSEAIPDLRNKQSVIDYLRSMCDYTAEEATQLLSRKRADGTDKTAEEYKADKETAKKAIMDKAFEVEMQSYLTYINAKK